MCSPGESPSRQTRWRGLDLDGRAALPVRVRQRAPQRGGPRRRCPSGATPAARAPRAVRRADQRHRVHPAPRGEPPHLGLPHHALGGAPGVLPHRQRLAAQRTVPRRRRRTRTGCAGTRCRSPTRPRTSSTACSPWAATATSRPHSGIGIHWYAANRSMTDRCFVDADGELLLVPESGALLIRTELGPLEVAPGEIAVVPRGIRFRVDLPVRARAATSARTTARRSRCPSAARSARTASRTNVTSWRRPRRTRTASPRCRSCRSSAATCGRPTTTTPRSTSSAGTATTCPTSTTWRTS